MPDYPRAKAITIKQLLGHRSGIFDYFAHPDYERKVFGRPHHHWSVPEILALRGPRYCEPNACFRYSNTNYVLLGQVVRKVTGKTPARLIRNRFLKPLGLTDTSFQGQEPIGDWAAMGYWTKPNGYRSWADGTAYRPNTSAATVAESAGAMLASVRDVSDWQDALFSGDVLEPESLERMLRFDERSGYGLGMRRAWLDGIAGIRARWLAARLRRDHVPAARPGHRRRPAHEPRERLAPGSRRCAHAHRAEEPPGGTARLTTRGPESCSTDPIERLRCSKARRSPRRAAPRRTSGARTEPSACW